MSQRILSGKWKGQTLAGSVGSKTRPTTSMMRQAVFNIWSDRLPDCRFLDLFAGTGAMGFEALSLEASHVTLVEKDRAAIIGIRKSIERLLEKFKEEKDKLTLKTLDVEKFLENTPSDSFDLIYADPPYDWQVHKKLMPGHYVVWLLTHLQRWIKPYGRLMIEQQRHVKEIIPPKFGGFTHLESRQYGDSMIHHFEFLPEQSTGPVQDLLSH